MSSASLGSTSKLGISAVVNGFVAVPVMAAMMWVGSQCDNMGRFVTNRFVRLLGWSATLVMASRQRRWRSFTDSDVSEPAKHRAQRERALDLIRRASPFMAGIRYVRLAQWSASLEAAA